MKKLLLFGLVSLQLTANAQVDGGCQPITNMPTATRDAGQICAGQDVVYTLNHPLATYYTFTAENG